MAFTRRKETLGIALEDTPGSAKAPTHYVTFLECSLAEKQAIIADNGAKGSRFGEGGSPVLGKKSGEGKVSIFLDPLTAPYWLAMALGSIQSNPESGSKFEHTMVLDQSNEPITATIWRGRVVDEVQFVNSVLNGWELSFADDIVKIDLDFVSQFPAEQSRSEAKSDLVYYTFKNALVQLGQATFKVRELKLKGDNQAELIYAPGDNNVDRIVVKTPKITGSFKLLFESEAQKDAFSGLTKQAMTVTFTGTNGDSITISIPQFRVENWTIDGGLDDIANENIEFTVEEDDESGAEEAISAVVVNDFEEYMTPES